MIEVSVSPGDLVAGRKAPLAIRFANTGPGRCCDVVFKLRMPPGVVLRGGSDRVEIPVIPAGRSHTHEITVEARQPGRFELTSNNFSYRDQYDTPVRVTDFHTTLAVAAAPVAAPVRQPTGRLRVRHEGGELELGAWDRLRVLVTNSTGVPLHGVTVSVEGPFLNDPKPSRVDTLGEGATARFSFQVQANQGGRHVPVTVHTRYGPARTQVDHLDLVVRAPAGNAGSPAPEALRILYITAAPAGDLRLDQEIRSVKAAVRSATGRDRVDIHHLPAATSSDLFDGLTRFRPHAVHFSGHANESMLLLDSGRDTRENGRRISAEAFAAALSAVDEPPAIVVLNACNSEPQLGRLVGSARIAIGMSDRVTDPAAINFASRLYAAIAEGQSVLGAFRVAKAEMRMNGFEDADLPILTQAVGVNPGTTVLVPRLPA
ncbi:CHAT domain-containing protein [Phytohabitans houttuyneae]|uniref:CHAT domain-containing protein n=1 Tax=Phytohabitans houttuyneae TaxID=1076126 RepID=A0A6V8KE30_9ACTN|nr:CHAT domain-containing protein [Phytohabitans houttuyneae]GFJ83492.1 hypothetical protein Phou_076720 [Phytohabitans houttuyneae]